MNFSNYKLQTLDFRLRTSHFSLRSSVFGLPTHITGLKKILLGFFLLLCLNAPAQTEKYKITEKDYKNESVEMADVMRQNGKIYVVVGVILIIFAGVTFYLYRLDKKVSAMEKEIQTGTKQS